MSKITNDRLTRSSIPRCFIAVRYPYGNSGRLKVNYNFVTFLRSVSCSVRAFVAARRRRIMVEKEDSLSSCFTVYRRWTTWFC